MATPQKAESHTPAAVKTAATGQSHAHIEKLAAFIQHHYHIKDASKAADAHVVELKGNKHVAEHLGISVAELERGFEALTKDQAIKRHGEYRVEIINKSRLAEIAKRAK